MSNAQNPVCLVIGAGDGVGSAIARAFAAEGFTICVTRRPKSQEHLDQLAQGLRDTGATAYAFGVDARKEEDTVELIERIEREIGPLQVVVFNIGANVRFGIRETTARVFSKVWEMACFAGFGTILFTGATASLRGAAGFAAFAAAKSGLRAVAQSMARELGPLGVHVAHVVIDGAIDGTFIRSMSNDVDALLERDAILKPDEIAKSYVWLHKQARSAWTHELDLRPWVEPF
jgi:NAD(P)-dependent dehydrogenase (short-subunit alcohol dehydrogenase family)